MTLKFYKCACATRHLHKISNLTKKIVSIGQFTFEYKVLKRYMIRKIVKQGIIWFLNMQIRYLKDLCERCFNAPEHSWGGGGGGKGALPQNFGRGACVIFFGFEIDKLIFLGVAQHELFFGE